MKNHLAAITLGIVSVLLLASCAQNPKEPGYQIDILTDMVDPVPYEAFSKNKNFNDGKTLQSPVQGSIPRGFEPFAYGASSEEAERAGRELVNPIKPDKLAMERGKFAYEIFCLQCHGAGGDGDGQLIPKYPNPPSFLSSKLIEMKDGQYFHATTLGKKDMPAHATQISAEDRWKIILYIRELQKSAQSQSKE